jgi:ABC-type Fe3+/spermidine/putrescine transport system ATPase subunit
MGHEPRLRIAQGGGMSALRLDSVAKSFGAVAALAPTDLAVAEGEFLTLLGPSGSGKTTILNICAGYLEPSAGRLHVGGRDITDLPPRRRNMGMVFQNYALFPHMSVFENVAYGLRVRRVGRAALQRRVDEALRLVRLDGFAERMISQLSGGQQQRVALARAFVIEPDILLMDEPLSALDRQLRKEVQLEVRRLHLARPRTTLYVTHDQEEALVMSDRIAVMRAGRIVQIGAGAELYEQPADAFVARFLGESNLIAGTMLWREGGRGALSVPGLERPLEGRLPRGPSADALAVGGAALALVRPESVRPAPDGIPATLIERVYLGELVALRLKLQGGQEIWCRRLGGDVPAGLTQLQIGWDADRVTLLPEV